VLWLVLGVISGYYWSLGLYVAVFSGFVVLCICGFRAFPGFVVLVSFVINMGF